VRVTALEGEDAAGRLEASVSWLAENRPDLSARTLLTRRQRIGLAGLAAVIVLAGIFDAVDTAIGVLSVLIAYYLAVVANRVWLFVRSRRALAVEVVSDAAARAYPADQLPTYTVLVPAYKEPEVIATLLANVERLDYPRDRLDVKLLLEADDEATIAAVTAADPGDHVDMVLVPPAEPRTKPKACNYALTFSSGDIVTIYDAEDQPDPLQLRRAAIALSRSGPETVCLQAELSFNNVDQNLLTRWFTLEYAMWFLLFLPGLVSAGGALPLGGTSNHFRRSALVELGGWDPYNVTEDADLGIRLARAGFRCGVLSSTTLEEANSDFINWVKQRSRWYKGYLQTALIHLRRPIQLWREVGWRGATQIVLFVLGTPMLAALNPFFWLMTVLWFAGHPHLIKELFPAPVFYVGTCCWIFGNFLICYLTILTCQFLRRYELLWAALLVPLYWVMMAIAAAKAFWQLFATPTFWEKTTHGLGHRRGAGEATIEAAV
jgi:cellulose synthase/poly-beta-1,6-N-acetylglucosamine synthase-like glycosyltransferase